MMTFNMQLNDREVNMLLEDVLKELTPEEQVFAQKIINKCLDLCIKSLEEMKIPEPIELIKPVKQAVTTVPKKEVTPE